MIPEISFVAREWVRSRLLDKVNGFNFAIIQACAIYGFPDFQLTSSNLYLGRYSLPNVLRSTNPNPWPLAILSVPRSDSTGRQAMKVTPSTFSGSVVVSVDFHIAYKGSSKLPPDGEAAFFAIESALNYCMNDPVSYPFTPQGLTYNNEILSDQGNMEWEGTHWLQQNSFAFITQRIA